MERIGIRELRQNASHYIARVRTGASVEITDRGDLVAVLVPPGDERSRRERLISAGWLIPAGDGRATPSEPAVGGLRRTPQPVSGTVSAPSNTELLDFERAERL